jgi:hypothetical protein
LSFDRRLPILTPGGANRRPAIRTIRARQPWFTRAELVLFALANGLIG